MDRMKEMPAVVYFPSFNFPFSTMYTVYVAYSDMTVVSDKLGKKWKKVVAVYLRIIHLPGVTEKTTNIARISSSQDF